MSPPDATATRSTSSRRHLDAEAAEGRDLQPESREVEAIRRADSDQALVAGSRRSRAETLFEGGYASQPGELAELLLNQRRFRVIVDACAAPGNKATHLAALALKERGLVRFQRESTRLARVELTVQAHSRGCKLFVSESLWSES